MTSLSSTDVSLLAEIDHVIPTSAGYARLESLRAAAVSAGNDALHYALLMRQATWAYLLGDIEAMVAHFAQSIAAHRSDPGRFPLSPAYPRVEPGS